MTEPKSTTLSARLRDTALGAMLALVGFYLVTALWGIVSYVSLPAFRWLSVAGYLKRGDPLNYYIMSIPDVIAVVAASLGLGLIVGRLTRAEWWVAVSSFAAVLALIAVDWSPGSEFRFFVLTHWLFWAFAGPAVLVLIYARRS